MGQEPQNGPPLVDTGAIRNAVGARGPAGGLIFFDKGFVSDGWRWLEAAREDLPEAQADFHTGIRWGNGSNGTTGAAATSIGSGLSNTATIIAMQGEGDYAAILCDSLVLGGYDDWFLPSREELALLLALQTTLGYSGAAECIASGGFAASRSSQGFVPLRTAPLWYWSSSEYSYYMAWMLQVDDAGPAASATADKIWPLAVRPVRAF